MKYIYCNPQVFQIVKPEKISKVIFDDYFLPYCIAGYDEKSYKNLLVFCTEERAKEEGAWWRLVGRTNIGLDETYDEKGYKPRKMREIGLLTYTCDNYGASTEKNVAAFIGEYAEHEAKNPIEFWNSLTKL